MNLETVFLTRLLKELNFYNLISVVINEKMLLTQLKDLLNCSWHYEEDCTKKLRYMLSGSIPPLMWDGAKAKEAYSLSSFQQEIAKIRPIWEGFKKINKVYQNATIVPTRTWVEEIAYKLSKEMDDAVESIRGDYDDNYSSPDYLSLDDLGGVSDGIIDFGKQMSDIALDSGALMHKGSEKYATKIKEIEALIEKEEKLLSAIAEKGESISALESTMDKIVKLKQVSCFLYSDKEKAIEKDKELNTLYQYAVED